MTVLAICLVLLVPVAIRACWRWLFGRRNTDGGGAGDGTVYEDVK